MRYQKVSSKKYMLRLERGEEVVETIAKFCEKEGVTSGILEGIGSVDDPTLAHYKVDTKKYSEKKIEGIFELISLNGNIAFFKNEPVVHVHCAIGDENMNVHGGHLVNAKISATAEIFVQILDERLNKSYNSEIGLKLFDFEDSL